MSTPALTEKENETGSADLFSTVSKTKMTFTQIIKLLLKRKEWTKGEWITEHESGIYFNNGTNGIRFRKEGTVVFDTGMWEWILIIFLTINLGK